MPYAFVQDVPASWLEYRCVTSALLEPVPRGLIVHVAGPVDEGVRMIDVWDSQAAWNTFRRERYSQGLGALGTSEPRFRDLDAVELVVGNALSGLRPAQHR